MKRKRNDAAGGSAARQAQSKRASRGGAKSRQKDHQVGHPPPHRPSPAARLLLRCYATVLPLREYVARGAEDNDARRRAQHLFDEADKDGCEHAAALRNLGRHLVGTQRQLPPLRAASSEVGHGIEGQMTDRLAGWHPDENEPTMSDVLRVVQRRLLRARDGLRKYAPRDILTLGYRLPDERDQILRAGPAPPAVNFYPNSQVLEIALCPAWRLLLRCIGREAMTSLLETTSVFAPVAKSNDCFRQLSGLPIADAAELVGAAKEGTKKVEGKSASALEGRGQAGQRDEEAGAGQRGKKRRRRSRRGSDEQTAAKPGAAQPLAATKSTMQVRFLQSTQAVNRKPSEVAFVRSRMFYARPVRDRSKQISVGLPPGHILERTRGGKSIRSATSTPNSDIPLAYPGDPKRHQSPIAERLRLVAKYVFPRQYGLHNAWTSQRDWKRTSQPFEDYSNRDKGIAARGAVRTPRRLRSALRLISVMVRKHDKLEYRRLLDACCPRKVPKGRLTQEARAVIASNMAEQTSRAPPLTAMTSSQLVAGSYDPTMGSVASLQRHTQAPHTSGEASSSHRIDAAALREARVGFKSRMQDKPPFSLYMASTSQVSRFVCTVVRAIVPIDFFGSRHNQSLLLKRIDELVRCRRFETLTMHQVLQGFRLTDVHWLLPVSKLARNQRSTAAEMRKRTELMCEFLYWLFDSLVVPLLRTTFYVTEAAAFRNRTIYFRQDDWIRSTGPLLERLKGTTFTRVAKADALALMAERELGYSHIRLLPKETGVRPIINLRRRSVKAGTAGAGAGAEATLGRSINTTLQAAFNILSMEKSERTTGSSVLGYNDIYVQLKNFKAELAGRGGAGAGEGSTKSKSARTPLYFVKVDVRSAFDTIDQDKLLSIVKDVLSRDSYTIQRFAQVTTIADRVKREHLKKACPEEEQGSFKDLAQRLAGALRHVIFSDAVVYPREERLAILRLLEQHVRGNLVKIGGEFYRQTVGVPQGSTLSTLLCCFYLADLERSELAFVNEPGSLLLRYTDDFLFVSTSRRLATRFFERMSEGHPRYGCYISPEKSLANFDLPIGGLGSGQFVPLLQGTTGFPWCGLLVDTKTLSVSADLSRYSSSHIGDSLTVELGRQQGKAMEQKLCHAIRSRCHVIFNDTRQNGTRGVLINAYYTFLVAGLKLSSYADALRLKGKRRTRLCLRAIERALIFAPSSIKARARAAAASLHADAQCGVRSSDVRWLGLAAMHDVLSLRPTKNGPVVTSLARQMKELAGTRGLRSLADAAWTSCQPVLETITF